MVRVADPEAVAAPEVTVADAVNVPAAAAADTLRIRRRLS